MRYLLCFISVFFLCFNSNAQFSDDKLDIQISNAGELLGFCYTSKKVDSLLVNSDSIFPTTYGEIPDEIIFSLPFKDQFVFAVNHPESYYQSCSFILISSITKANKEIHSNFPSAMEGTVISERQLNLLIEKRDSSIIYINECFLTQNYIGNPIKKMILNLNGVECIPNIIRLVQTPDCFDTYNLTLLMKLMLNNKYEPFLQSELYKAFYSEDKMWNTNFGLTKKNANLIIELSTGFYNIQMEK
jgi:hypothetical protein